MQIACFSSEYRVRKMTEEDISSVLKLYRGNPDYFVYCPPEASAESVRADMRALPPGKTPEDKYFIGFFQDGFLVAVMDLIDRYPDDDTAFIGLFMVARERQGAGVGTGILSGCLQSLKREGYSRVRLGYVQGNPQARAFWRKNHFCPTGVRRAQELYTIVEMERKL